MRASVHRLDATFSALADPTRWTILTYLAKRESLVKDLAAPFDISPPAISKHLRVLEQVGLLARRREGQGLRCRLVAGPMKEAAGWITRYQRFWEWQFDALERHLAQLPVSDEPDTTQIVTTSSQRGFRPAAPRQRRRSRKARQSKFANFAARASLSSGPTLNTTFAALANSTRRPILTQLAERESSVTELAAPYHMSMPAVSKHLRVVGQAGPLTQTKEGRARRCRLVAEPMAVP